MKILDMTAGNRAVWYNKKNPLALFLDLRPEMNPDIVCDIRALPAEVGSGFDLVILDPPHLNVGPTSHMAKRYGHWTTAHILSTVEGASKEAHRVTKPGALLALKWNDHSIRLQRVFDLMPHWEPLCGHLTKDGSTSKSQTYWCLMRRKGPPKPGGGHF